MKRVLITSEYFGKYSDVARKLLTDAGLDVVDNPYGHKRLSKAEILPYMATANAIICDLENIDRDVIDAAPLLEIIARRGVGTDNVDCAYANEKGIAVARTPGVVEAPVAELVMSYILDMSRRISEMDRHMHCGRWQRVQCHSVDGSVLGIVGMGKIGYEVARRAAAFGMKIIYYDINECIRAESEFGVERRGFYELLEDADFVTLHLPLTEKTRGMMNDSAFSHMRSDAYLINTARGGIVDTAALVRALQRGSIKGAAIDVYEHEPDTESPLKQFDSVRLTPHVGTFTEEVFIKMDVAAARNVIAKLVK